MNNDKNTKIYIKEFYTLQQVCEELDLNIQTLRQYVNTGYNGIRLKASKIGHTYYTTRDNINEFLKEFESEKGNC